MDEECEEEFYRYNDLAIVYECAKILVSKSFVEKSEKDRLIEYTRSHHRVFDSIIEYRKQDSFSKILREIRGNLLLLCRSTEEIDLIISLYKNKYPEISWALPPSDSPAKRFEEFIHRKMKRSLPRAR